MIRGLFIALAATASLGAACPALAQVPDRDLGGGFFEYMVTGRQPYARPYYYGPGRPRPARRVVRAPPGYGAPPYGRRVIYGAPPADPFADDGYYRGRVTYGPPPYDPFEVFNGPRRPPPSARRRVAALPDASDVAPLQRGSVAAQYRRQVVPYNGKAEPGTVVIDTTNRFLYLVQGGGTAIRYGIGVGRQGFTWKGIEQISSKREWPDWRPPAQMLKRRPDLPRYMAGGPDNPLGARALYLGNTLFRIHGTNEPWTIGHAVSSGCIRMMNEDVIDLYNRVGIGTRVVVS